MSDQYVRVPRELLLRLLSVYSTSPYPAWHELAAALDAAPAEDVRAVGDDAVAWRSFDGEGGYDFTDDCETGERWMQVNGPDWVTPLYSRPQRPAVSPERKPEPYKVSVGLIPYHEGWNACIDEFGRLNK